MELDIPRVETDRLVLRGHRMADFPAIRDMWADPAVTRYIGGKPRPEEECWMKFLRGTGFWVHLGFGYWIVEERSSGRFVGELGFGDFKREMTPSLKGEMEAGWAFAAAAHGKGYATEALRGALGWAEKAFPGRGAVCIIDPANAPSVRVAEKAGFVQTGAGIYHGATVNTYRRG